MSVSTDFRRLIMFLKKPEKVACSGIGLPDDHSTDLRTSEVVSNAIPAGDPVPATEELAEIPEQVLDAVAVAIGGSAYDCMRVWSAWGVGTMGPDDFWPMAEDSERVEEIARAAILAWEARKALAKVAVSESGPE